MNQPSKPLAGKRVAFTGRLASLTRREAAALVRQHGGRFVPAVSRQTALVVVGQEGWPLRKDGRLTRKLMLARQLQAAGAAVQVVTELDFLERLGLDGRRPGIHGRFTLAELGRMLKVPRDRLRAWMRLGLIVPAEERQGLAYFDFHQVTGIRALWDMARGGVTLERLRRSLHKLMRWLPAFNLTPEQLQLIERNGQVLIRLQQGHLVEPSGQLHLDFEADNAVPALPAERPPDADTWFDRGCDFEQQGQVAEAIEAYRQALYAGGPDAVICFNLGNVLYQAGQAAAAAERFRQAVEIDHEFAEAWNNLGNMLMEGNETSAALAAYRRAVALAPEYADAHYNLADALQRVESFSEARIHWKNFVRLTPVGPWADYARRQLRQ